MQGHFIFLDRDGWLCEVYNSADIPADAKELIKFYIPNRPEPHSQEDHEHDAQIAVEFDRVKRMIYDA